MITDIAGPLVAAGEATLDVEASDGPRPTVIELRPANPAASPIAVQVDWEGQVTLYLGRHRTVCELVDRNRARLLETIRGFLEAVLAGRYREHVRLKDGRVAFARGRLLVGDRTHQIRYSDFSTFGRGSPLQELTYEPY